MIHKLRLLNKLQLLNHDDKLRLLKKFELLNYENELPYAPISPIYNLAISSIFIILILFFYITSNVIPSKAEEYLKQTYPEYELSE